MLFRLLERERVTCEDGYTLLILIHEILAKLILYNERSTFERMLHNIPINWITFALSQINTL